MARPIHITFSALIALGCATGSDGIIGDDDDSGEGGSLAGDDGGGLSTADGGAQGVTTQASTTSTTTSTTTTGDSTTTNTSSSSTGGAGGGPPEVLANVLMIAGGGSSTISSRYDVLQNSGFSWPWLEPTWAPMGLARIAQGGTSHAFIARYPDGTLLHSQWTGTNWLLMTPVQADLVVQGGVSTAASLTDLHTVYQLPDGSLGYTRIDELGLFNPATEVIGSPISYAAGSPAVGASVAGPVVVFVTAEGELVDRTRIAGAWTSENPHGLIGEVQSLTPAIVAPETGSVELIVAFIRASDNAVMVQTRSAGAWSVAVPVEGAFSTAAPRLAALSTGEIILTYMSPDQGGWMASFNGAFASFDPPELLVQGVICPPAFASGAEGADAEMMYLDTIGVGYWSRRNGDQWTTPSFATTAGPPSCVALTASP